MSSNPGALDQLQKLTLDDARALRDTEWEKRERSYHDAAISEVNETVRRYNGVAPYAVRRTYYTREKELQKAYLDGGQAILEGVRERLQDGRPLLFRGSTDEDELSHPSSLSFALSTGLGAGFWRSIKALIREWRGQRVAS